LIFDQFAGMLFGFFSFSLFGLISGLSLFSFSSNIISYIILNLIWTLAFMYLGTIIGYLQIFLFETENFGEYDSQIRIGDNSLEQQKIKLDETLIND